MSVGYGTPKGALPAVGDSEPTATQTLLDDVAELQDTLEQKVTETGVDFSAVAWPAHGTDTKYLGPECGVLVGGTGTIPATTVHYWTNANSLALRFGLPFLSVGDRLLTVTAHVRPNGVGQQWTCTVRLIENYGNQVANNSATSTTGTSDEDVAVTVSPQAALTAGRYYVVTLSTSSAVATPRVYGITCTWDRP